MADTPNTLPADFFDGQASKAPPAPDTLPADFFERQAAPPAAIAAPPAAPAIPAAAAPPANFLPAFTGPLADPKNPASRLPSAAEAQQLATDEAKRYVDQLTGRPAQAPIPPALQPDQQAAPPPQPIQVGSPQIQQPAAPGGFINPKLTQPTANVQRPAKPTYTQGIEALQSGNFKEAHEILSQPPEFVSKPVDELNKFLVGPFQFHAAVAKAAASLTSPENLAIGAATGGLGAAAQGGSTLVRASAQAINAGLSAYFATQAGKSLIEHTPELAKAVKEGDLSGIASSLGFMSADAMMVYLAGSHAKDSAITAAGEANAFADNFREGGKYGKAQRTNAEVVPDYSTLSDDQLVGEYNKAHANGQATTKADIAHEIMMRQAMRKPKQLEAGRQPDAVYEDNEDSSPPAGAPTKPPPDTLPPDFFDGEKPGAAPSAEPAESLGEAPISPVAAENGETPAKPPLPKMNDAMQAAHDQASAMHAEAVKDGDQFRIDAAARHVEFIEELVRASAYKAPPPKHTAENLADQYAASGMQPVPGSIATPEEIRAGAELAIEKHNAENPAAVEEKPVVEGAPAGSPDDREADAKAPEAEGAADVAQRSGSIDAGSPAEEAGRVKAVAEPNDKDGTSQIAYLDPAGNRVGVARLNGDLILSVQVDPAHQRRGYGAQIVQDLVGRGGRRGTAGTDAGAALLEKAGFSREGETNEYSLKPAAPKPGTVAELPVKSIAVDPARFQFKADMGQGGAGEELRDLKKFDPVQGGVVLAWHDPADGKTYIVNGHNRLALASRTGTQKILVRYIDAKDAQEARAIGALVNIGEGRGTSIDAAKVFRDRGIDEAGLAAHNIAIKGEKAREGMALSKLDPHLFGKVVSGEIPPARAAVIGAGLPEHADQRAIYDVIQKRDKAGKRLTNDQIEEMIRLAKSGPQRTEVQESLFGAEEVTRSLIAEKAEVSDYIRKQLAGEKKLFGVVGDESVAAKLSQRGNVIKAGENQAVADQAAQALAIYDKLSGRSGPVSDALGRAAAELAEGNDATKTKQAAYLRIRQALAGEASGLAGVPHESNRPVEGHGGQGPREAGQGQHDPADPQSQLDSAGGKPLYAYPKFGGPTIEKGSNVARLADESRARLGRFGKSREPVVYVNRQALTLIRRASIQLGGDSSMAMAMPSGTAARAIHNLREALPRLTAERAAKVQAVLDVLEQSQRIRPGAVAVVATDGYSDKDIRDASQEELNHIAQFRATGELQNFHLGGFDQAARFLQSPEGVKAAAALVKAGYPALSVSTLVMEAGVRLMEPGRYRELGLTAAEGEGLAERYIAALNAAHGPLKIAKVIEKVYKAFGEQINGRDRQGNAAVVFGSRRGGQNRSAVGQNPQGTGAGSVPRRVARADGQGSLFANRRLEGEQSDLFASDGGAQREAEDLAERQLEGDRLTAEFQSELRRGKAVKKAKAPPQTNLFEDTPEEPQRSLFNMGNRGAVNLNAATLGVSKLIEKDIRPGIVAAGKLIVASRDELLRMFAPGARGPNAAGTHAELRNTGAELARRMDIARAALKEASKQLMRLPEADRWAFVHAIELGKPQPSAELQGIADTMRDMLDAARVQVQALGKGKLASYYANYFPHAWADPQKAAIAIASMISRRPFDGKKGFLKKRTIITVQEGMAAGLVPISNNPVEIVLAKLGEMQRYITAQNALTHEKAAKRMKYVDARNGKAPKGWQKVEDAIATVYGDSIQHITEYPNEGLWNGLHAVANALGIKHERGFKPMGQAIGRANQATGNVRTMHGTAEDVLAHEIGHQIDWKAGSGKRFVLEYPDAATVGRLKRAYATIKDPASTPDDRKAARAELKSLRPSIADRKEFAKQLRDLADLRGGRPEYTHKREEKMAQLAEMWVGARELFERTAPKVFAEWKKFLDESPKLHALRDIEGNTEVAAIAQPYDVGGLVIKGHWWAPEESARLFNNYLAPGLRSKSALFRAYSGVGNVLLQFQLGWSAFHATFVSLEAMTSRFALGVYQANHGAPGQGLKSMAIGLTPASPFLNYAAGKKIQAAWDRPGSQAPLVEQMADAVVSAGGRASVERHLQTGFTARMVEAVRAGNILGGMLRAPFALTEQAARPIMEFLVPRMKLGAFAKMAEFEIERAGGANADPEALRQALGRAWDSVDNRFGQLVYDNLAWHRVMKDLMQGSIRTVGWNTGDIREMGGGAVDALKALKNVPGAKRFEISHRLAYLLSIGVVVGVYGAITNKILSGDWPEELRDYYYPKDGEGGRVSMPSYVKEIVSAAHDPTGWAKGKLHPLLTFFGDMLSNKDYFGRPIAKADDDLVDRALARLKYAGQMFKPISVQGLQRSDTTKGKALPFVGFPKAPKYVDDGAGVSDGGGLLDTPKRSRAGSDPELDRLLGR